MSFESVYVRRVELQARRSDIARLPRERGHSPLTSSESCLLGFSGLTIEDRERNGGGMMVVECVVRGTSSDVGIHNRSQENVRQFNGSPARSHARDLFAIAARGSRSPGDCIGTSRARVSSGRSTRRSRLMGLNSSLKRSAETKFGPRIFS